MDVKKNNRKTRTAVVLSHKMNKTCVVQVTTVGAHKFFRKVVKNSRKFYVHDEKNSAGVGDVVLISETRPLSRLKRWRLVKIIKKSVGQFQVPEEKLV